MDPGPRRRDGVATRGVEDGAVLLDPDGGVHLLSPTGSAVWAALDGSTTARLVDGLARDYGASPAEVGPGVEQMLADLGSRGLLAGPAPSAGPEPGPRPRGAHAVPEPPSP